MSTWSQHTSPTPGPEPDEALQAVIKAYIGSTLKAATERSTKRLQDADGAKNLSPKDKAFPAFGRSYGRQDDPFTTVDTIVNFGIKHETVEEEDDDEIEVQTLSIREKRLLCSWELLCSIIPDFCNQMLALSVHRALRKATCQQIYQGVSTVRADDSSSLKAWIPTYILINPNDSLSPAISIRSKLKNDRGFHHPATASLLCPVKYPDTSETYADIRAGRLPLTATLLPRFLFPHDHVYDAADMSKDLLCGHVMFRAAKHIFQGPSSALEEPGFHRGKQGNAALCGITSMTPRTIAYVATQVRFALSSTTSWVAKDGAFSYTDFYWHIVGLLDDEDDPECQEIIKFYNYHVFGAEGPHANSTEVAEVEDDYELIKQQRAAKRARLSQ